MNSRLPIRNSCRRSAPERARRRVRPGTDRPAIRSSPAGRRGWNEAVVQEARLAGPHSPFTTCPTTAPNCWGDRVAEFPCPAVPAECREDEGFERPLLDSFNSTSTNAAACTRPEASFSVVAGSRTWSAARKASVYAGENSFLSATGSCFVYRPPRTVPVHQDVLEVRYEQGFARRPSRFQRSQDEALPRPFALGGLLLVHGTACRGWRLGTPSILFRFSSLCSAGVQLGYPGSWSSSKYLTSMVTPAHQYPFSFWRGVLVVFQSFSVDIRSMVTNSCRA